MYPILFQIGNLTFYTHGVVAVLGIIIGSLIAYSLARRKQLDTEYFFDIIVFTILLGIIGARIAYFIVYPDQFKNLSQIIFLWDGGLISFGGFILAGITLALLLKAQKRPIFKWLDIISIGFFLGLAIARLFGDILAGEYAGTPTDSKLLKVFSSNSVVLVPFFEGILCLIIFITAILLFKKYYEKLLPGLLFMGSILAYTLGRFFIDFGRDEADLFLKFSLGQVVSALIFIISAISIILVIRKRSSYEIVK